MTLTLRLAIALVAVTFAALLAIPVTQAQAHAAHHHAHHVDRTDMAASQNAVDRSEIVDQSAGSHELVSPAFSAELSAADAGHIAPCNGNCCKRLTSCCSVSGLFATTGIIGHESGSYKRLRPHSAVGLASTFPAPLLKPPKVFA